MFLGRQPDDGYNHDDDKAYRMSHELVGVVTSVSNGKATVALRNNLTIGDSIEFLTTGLENQMMEVAEMYNPKGTCITSGRNEETVSIPILKGVREHDLIRRPVNANQGSCRL